MDGLGPSTLYAQARTPALPVQLLLDADIEPEAQF
jgi:hypothetical protein